MWPTVNFFFFVMLPFNEGLTNANDDIGEVVYNENDRYRSDLVGKSFLTNLLVTDDLLEHRALAI